MLETEESVRRDVARELHDDIVRPSQPFVLRRALFSGWRQIRQREAERAAHRTTVAGRVRRVRRLLGRLRPRQLDDLSLERPSAH